MMAARRRHCERTLRMASVAVSPATTTRARPAVIEEKRILGSRERLADGHRDRAQLHTAPEDLGELRTIGQREKHPLLDVDVEGAERIPDAVGAEADLLIGHAAARAAKGR